MSQVIDPQICIPTDRHKKISGFIFKFISICMHEIPVQLQILEILLAYKKVYEYIFPFKNIYLTIILGKGIPIDDT